MLGVVGGTNTGEYGALFYAEIQRELQQFIGFDHQFGVEDFSDTQIDARKIVDRNRLRNFLDYDGLRRFRRHQRKFAVGCGQVVVGGFGVYLRVGGFVCLGRGFVGLRSGLGDGIGSRQGFCAGLKQGVDLFGVDTAH